MRLRPNYGAEKRKLRKANRAQLRKPSLNERAIAALSAAFDRGDMDMVRRLDAQVEHRMRGAILVLKKRIVCSL